MVDIVILVLSLVILWETGKAGDTPIANGTGSDSVVVEKLAIAGRNYSIDEGVPETSAIPCPAGKSRKASKKNR
jgi:hypothetical protein